MILRRLGHQDAPLLVEELDRAQQDGIRIPDEVMVHLGTAKAPGILEQLLEIPPGPARKGWDGQAANIVQLHAGDQFVLVDERHRLAERGGKGREVHPRRGHDDRMARQMSAHPVDGEAERVQVAPAAGGEDLERNVLHTPGVRTARRGHARCRSPFV